MPADHQGKWSSQTWQGESQISISVCEMGPDWRQRRESFPSVEFNLKKTRLTCNNKSRCQGQNTFLKKCYCDISSMLDFELRRWDDRREIMRADRQSPCPDNGSGSGCRFEMLEFECWNAPEDRDTTADNHLPANQTIKSITNQQVGVIWWAEASFSDKGHSTYDNHPLKKVERQLIHRGCVNNRGGPE